MGICESCGQPTELTEDQKQFAALLAKKISAETMSMASQLVASLCVSANQLTTDAILNASQECRKNVN